MKYLIGNWKANKTRQEALDWISEVKQKNLTLEPGLTVILCPSFIHLLLFREAYPELPLGCQDLSPYGDGAYTGEISARMLKSLVQYAILGHSERRRYFQESSIQVAQKALQAIDNYIIPIIAVDRQNWRQQLIALDEAVRKQSILMYEPPEAISEQTGPIGKGTPASLEEVKQMIGAIREEAEPLAVIYGGSVKANSIATFLKEPTIDGILPGSASLNAAEWIKMVTTANQIIKVSR